MNQLLNYIDNFSTRKIMVIGDIIADEFIIGKPERLSREAPVIILEHQERDILPGGSANASNNIDSLGGQVELIGLIGNDDPGISLKEMLGNKGINTDGLLIDNQRPTSLKTRILAGGDQVVKQQVVRIDHLDNSPLSAKSEKIIIEYINKKIDEVDAVLLSDYGNGVFTDRIKKQVIELARLKDRFIAVDSRYDLLDFKGVTIATPNLEEAGMALNREIKTQAGVVSAGRKLIKKLEARYLLITQGEEGMTLFKPDGDYIHLPVENLSEVYDVTGAGDTVVGTLVLAYSTGATMFEAMKLANYAAGIVVRKTGVATVTPGELREEVKENG